MTGYTYSQQAAQRAHAVVAKHLPHRVHDAADLVRELFTCALAKSSPAGHLNLITVVHPNTARFEVHYSSDLNAQDPLTAHQSVSALADASGPRPTRNGRMIYAELWDYAP
ncbi:hypothetical protein [Nonomuraea glycinis]|uniref:hypothetical protein n=1 Tax=Nonomuraea glycinis TaxID=2047744 RepID=UPI002E155DEB|nr:hypothetical protein OHA68_14445 [Nonomuraea glycinis]